MSAEDSTQEASTSASKSNTKLSRPEPVTVLCSTPSAQLVIGAINTSLYLFDSASSTLLAQSSNETQHNQRIRLLAATNDKLVSTGDDKLIKVWGLPGLELLSTRSLPKRANTFRITEDAQTIAVGDKFGDVFSLLLDANQELASTGTKEGLAEAEASDEKEAEKRQPVLGHVSMLTALTFYNSVEYGQTIITADRDEHIRVSKWPQGLEIVQYLLGHLKFVSALLVDEKNDRLYSAGGEEELYIWDLKQLKLNGKRDISTLRQYAQIPSPARQQGQNDNKKGKGKGKKQPQQSQETQEQQQRPETESERQVRIAEEKPIVVQSLFALAEHWIGVTSIGASAVLAVHRDDAVTPPQVLDLHYPVMSLCRLPGDRFLVALDLVHGSREVAQDTQGSAIFSFKDASFSREDDSSLVSALNTLPPGPLYPTTQSLYPDLSLLYKENYQGEGGPTEAMESTAPRDRKLGRAPPNAGQHQTGKKGKGQGENKRQKTK